ncbi:ribokinase [Paenibacillus sp. M1]|uniref:Ribokinase n=1 Tax=Paenibacillus haidiansis TaxID=1574488 RepID=A0ABU7VTM1_9BACL
MGDDFFGHEIRHRLAETRIGLEHVVSKPIMTGMALITVDHRGENNIILSPGANGAYGAEDVASLELSGYDAILLQNEIPGGTNRAVLEKAKHAGIPVFANPAPVAGFERQHLASIHFLILNEIEAEALTGVKIKDVTQARQACGEIVKRGVKGVIVTLGGKGSLYMDSGGLTITTPAYRVEAVDTTAAGDTFIGAFVSKYLSGEGMEYCLLYATAASALAVSSYGAQSSIPEEAQVLEFMSGNRDLL